MNNDIPSINRKTADFRWRNAHVDHVYIGKVDGLWVRSKSESDCHVPRIDHTFPRFNGMLRSGVIIFMGYVEKTEFIMAVNPAYKPKRHGDDILEEIKLKLNPKTFMYDMWHRSSLFRADGEPDWWYTGISYSMDEIKRRIDNGTWCQIEDDKEMVISRFTNEQGEMVVIVQTGDVLVAHCKGMMPIVMPCDAVVRSIDNGSLIPID